MKPCPKPDVPLALERHARKLERQQAADAVKAAAKRRDGYRCRWPHCEYHAVTQGRVIDAAHLQAAGSGGDPALVRTTRDNLIALCRLHHRTAPENLHNAKLKIEPLTPEGTDGPCAFYRWTVADGWYVVASESAIGILEKD